MLCTQIVLNVKNNFCTQDVLPICNSMNNLSSYCGLLDAKIRASDKDLPVQEYVSEKDLPVIKVWPYVKIG